MSYLPIRVSDFVYEGYRPSLVSHIIKHSASTIAIVVEEYKGNIATIVVS